MKTNYIPAIIMLLAGFLDCLFGIINRLDAKTFITELLIVLVVFYFIGIVIKVVLDKNFMKMNQDADTNSAEEKDESREGEDSSVRKDAEV